MKVMAVVLAAIALLEPSAARAAGPDVAAVQVALGAHGLYAGAVDGVAGPATVDGVRRLQRRAGLVVDGLVGPQTRRALGRLGRHPIGSRTLRAGDVGFDVAALQFALESHGFPLGTVDGGYGPHTVAAVTRAQAFGGLPQDGVAGPATQALLRRAPPAAPPLLPPIRAPLGDRFGPRGHGWHPGLDFPAPTGTPVTAAAPGRVESAGYDDGYGLVVAIAGGGSEELYAHLSAAAVRPGEPVSGGQLVGRVGATGYATGPHLHFEVRIRGAAVDPAPSLGLR
jgi:murein DD-endopeptidase MepM/ murein hydrolase activator NlpD